MEHIALYGMWQGRKMKGKKGAQTRLKYPLKEEDKTAIFLPDDNSTVNVKLKITL